MDDGSGFGKHAVAGDGIGDTLIPHPDEDYDFYPYMKPCGRWISPAPVEATIDIDPDTLNLKSNGQWITVYIELPEGFTAGDIDVDSILLSDTIPVDVEAPADVGDYDLDTVPDLMVKFDRAAISEWLGTIDYSEDTGKYYEINMTVTGTVVETQFAGTDNIRVLMK